MAWIRAPGARCGAFSGELLPAHRAPHCRRLQLMDWSLYRCGRMGHITYAPDEPHLREHMRGETGSAELWQCLRCGTYVSGASVGSGPVADAPAVKRGKQIRADFYLKLFAVERAIRVVIFGGV